MFKNLNVSSSTVVQTAILAIDPGVSGAIVCCAPTLKLTISRNKEAGEAGTLKFIQSLVQSYQHALESYPIVAYMEKVGGFIPKGPDDEGQPGSRMFTFGDNYGYIRGALDALGIKRVMVVPQVWQRGIAGVKGKSGPERKRLLKAHAERLFPSEAVDLQNCDALGILHYARAVEGISNAGYPDRADTGPTPIVAKPKAEPFNAILSAMDRAEAIAYCRSVQITQGTFSEIECLKAETRAAEKGWKVPDVPTFYREMLRWYFNR